MAEMTRFGMCRTLTVRLSLVQNRHMRRVGLVAVLAVTLCASGCQVAGRAVQSAAMSDKLAGTWTLQGSNDLQLRLEADGTYRANLWGSRGSGQWTYSKPFLVLTGTDRQERMSLEAWGFKDEPNWIELGSNGSTVRLIRGQRQPRRLQPESQARTQSSPATSFQPQAPQRARCIPCNGSGKQDCLECSGTGQVVRNVQSSGSPTGSNWTSVTCPSCSGRRTDTCWACRGSGLGP